MYNHAIKKVDCTHCSLLAHKRSPVLSSRRRMLRCSSSTSKLSSGQFCLTSLPLFFTFPFKYLWVLLLLLLLLRRTLNHPDLLHDVQGVIRRRRDDTMVVSSVCLLVMMTIMILCGWWRETDCVLKYHVQWICNRVVVIIVVVVIRRRFSSLHHRRLFPNDVLFRITLLLWR